MCGRFTIKATPQEILARFGVDRMLFEPVPRYNAAPTQVVPVVRLQDGERVSEGHSWGLLQPWARDNAKQAMTINARIEGLKGDPKVTASYAPALKARRRCIIIGDGFYEWKKIQTSSRKKDIVKIPHYFRFKDHRPFAMAGLWQEWTGQVSRKNHEGERVQKKVTIQTVTMLTALPIKTVENVHDWSPIILPRDQEGLWLDPAISSE